MSEQETTLTDFDQEENEPDQSVDDDPDTLDQEQFGPFTLSTPGEWTAKRLGDLKRLITRGKQPTYADEGVPVINQECIYWDGWHFENLRYLDEDVAEEWKDKYFPKRGDVILNSTGQGTLGRAQVYPDAERRAIDSHVTLLRTDEDLSPYFHRYFLESHLGQALLYSMCVNGSTGQIELSKTRLDLFPVPLPPLEEQRKIASVLCTVDQAIQKTEEIIQQTERLHTGLRRKLVIGGIGHEEFQEMRVGPFSFEIPESWGIVSVDESCENLDKDRIPVKQAKREEMQGDIPYYGASGIIDYVDDYLFDDDLILLAEDGENLLSRNLPISFKISGKAWVNNHAHVLKPREDFDIDYLVEYFERLNYEPFVTGSAQPKLTQTNMEMLSMPKPPEEEQTEISSVLTSVSEYKNRSEQYKEKLQRLKQGLMQDLLSGEIRTHDKDIEILDEVRQHG